MIFFFIAFSLLLVTQSLIGEQYGVSAWDFSTAILGALIVGKILLIVDKLAFVNRFPDRPLIYNTLWKTFIYNVAALFVRYLEQIIPRLVDGGGFGQANADIYSSIVWPHFWLVQLWLAVLFFVYCAVRELIRKIGADTVKGMFLGTASAESG